MGAKKYFDVGCDIQYFLNLTYKIIRVQWQFKRQYGLELSIHSHGQAVIQKFEYMFKLRLC